MMGLDVRNLFVAVSYDLRNIGSNFAFDRSQSYFDSGAGLKIGGSFLIGAFGGMGQYGIMKGGESEAGLMTPPG